MAKPSPQAHSSVRSGRFKTLWLSPSSDFFVFSSSVFLLVFLFFLLLFFFFR